MNREELINEFNEKIDAKEIEDLTNRILKLSKRKIDKLWLNCGFIREDKGKNKALPEKILNKMVKDKDFANKLVRNLLYETYLQDFLSELDSAEDGK